MRGILLVGALLLGCSRGQYTLVAQLDGVPNAETVEIALVPSCAGQTLGAPPMSATVHAIAHRSGAVMSAGTTVSGTFGLYALARNDACAVVGAGCVQVQLAAGGSGELVVPVAAMSGPACTMTCDHGICGSSGLDAGMDGGLPYDGAMQDGFMPPIDVGPLDTGPALPDAGGDGGPPGDPPTRIHAAQVRGTTAYCICIAPPDYPTVPDCLEGQLPPAPVFDCRATAYATNPSALFAHFDCVATVESTYADCREGARCNDTIDGTCGDTEMTQLDACPNPSTAAQDAYDNAYSDCVNANVIGSAADTCSDSATPSMAVGDAVFSGTTIGAGNHHLFSCGAGAGGSGADVSYRWRAPSAGMWTIDTANSYFDTVLALLSSCGATTELGCDDDGGSFATSSITIALTAGQTIQIVVQAFATDEGGRYFVNIHTP